MGNITRTAQRYFAGISEKIRQIIPNLLGIILINFKMSSSSISSEFAEEATEQLPLRCPSGQSGVLDFFSTHFPKISRVFFIVNMLSIA